MIYLIGGAPKSGKTFLANHILKEKKISFFQTDYLMMGLNKDLRIGVDSDSNDFLVSSILEPILIKMITAMIENKETYLIEGVHLMPSLLRKLKDKYCDDIICCTIGYTLISKERKIKEIIENSKDINNNWYCNMNENEFLKSIEEAILESKEIKEQSKKLNIKYFEINDIKEDIKDIMSYLELTK